MHKFMYAYITYFAWLYKAFCSYITYMHCISMHFILFQYRYIPLYCIHIIWINVYNNRKRYRKKYNPTLKKWTFTSFIFVGQYYILHIHIYIYLSNYLSIYLSVCLSICIYIYIYIYHVLRNNINIVAVMSPTTPTTSRLAVRIPGRALRFQLLWGPHWSIFVYINILIPMDPAVHSEKNHVVKIRGPSQVAFWKVCRAMQSIGTYIYIYVYYIIICTHNICIAV